MCLVVEGIASSLDRFDFGLKLTDLFRFSCGLTCCLNAVRVEAGQALGLAEDSHASVTTFLLISAGEE